MSFLVLRIEDLRKNVQFQDPGVHQAVCSLHGVLVVNIRCVDGQYTVSGTIHGAAYSMIPYFVSARDFSRTTWILQR